MSDDDLTPIDAEETTFCAFIASYESALADGRPPPSPDDLPPRLRGRWERTRKVFHLLEKVGNSRSGTPQLVRPGADDRPRESLGRYRLIRELGRGGMGIVYLAHDPELHREVAVKVLPPAAGEDKKRLARFEAEGRLLARQRHPNIVQIHEAGTDAGRPYLVMEYVDGPALSRRLAGRPMEPRAAAILLAQLARALAHAHAQSIIHRDLKPANVLLTADGAPKISDFGLATNLGHSLDLTRTGEVLGTPAYMAPEMVTNAEAAGPAVDVYGLGVILYECLTGRPPFVGTNPVLVLAQVQYIDPLGPRRLSPEVPTDLETVCLKCLSKDRGKRYASAGELADDLQRFLDGRPILARRTSRVERAAKFVRRRPAMAAAWGIGIAAALALTAVVGGYSLRLEEERRNLATQEGIAREARGKAEGLVIDLNVTLGLSAEKAGNWSESALWFAHAARQAEPDAARVQANRIRWRTYTAASPVPWRAVQIPDCERVDSLALAPDGRWLIVAANSRWTLWDMAGERPAPWPADVKDVTCAAWSPDGRSLATGSRDGRVCHFSFPEGRLTGEASVKGPVACLAWDPAGHLLAAGDAEHWLRTWAVGNSMEVVLEHRQTAPILSINFSPSSTRLYSICSSQGAWVFALPAEGQPSRLLLGPISLDRRNSGFTWREGSGFLSDDELVTSNGGEVKVWDVTTGEVRERIAGDTYGQSAIAVSAAGQYIVLEHWFQEPGFWTRDKERRPVTRTLRTQPAETVAVRPDGAQFLVGYKNGLQLFNRDRSPAGGILWHQGRPEALSWSADGRWFATAGGPVVRLWRAAEGRPLCAALPVPKNVFLPLVFAPSQTGARVLTASDRDGRASFQVFALADGRAEGPAVTVPGLPTGAALSPDGETVFAVTTTESRGQLHAWDRATGRPAFASVELDFDPYDLGCGRDGATLALAGGHGDVEVREAATGKLVRRHRGEGFVAQPHFMADRVRFAPDGRSFFTCGRQVPIFQWDAHDGAAVCRLEGPPGERAVDGRPSPDGRFLVTAGLIAKQAAVWDLAARKPAATALRHPDAVFAARFDPSGSRVVTACRDGKTRIWDWRAGELTVPPLAHVEEVTDAAFSPDGRWVASAEAGGIARLWDANTGLPLAPGWNLQPPGFSPPYYANRVEFSADGRYALVGVRGSRLFVFDLSLLHRSLGPELTSDDAVLLAEINAGSLLLANGTVQPLSAGQWLQRWHRFRRSQPNYHPMPPTEKPSP